MLDTTADLALVQNRIDSSQQMLRRAGESGRARQTAEEFEALFLSQMLQPMFNGIETEAPFGGGHAETIWRGMLVDHYGKAMTKAGGIGIADTIERQILSLQEVTQR
ncbi:MAG: rod-binding protein [Magnetospiraceae bacterium]